MCVIHVVIVALSCTLFRLITEMQMESHRGITVSFFLFSFFFFRDSCRVDRRVFNALRRRMAKNCGALLLIASLIKKSVRRDSLAMKDIVNGSISMNNVCDVYVVFNVYIKRST